MYVDLDDHRSGQSRVFSGRDRGESVRDSSELKNFDKKEVEKIEIKIPKDTYIVTSSFLLGMLGDIIRKLGKERAREYVVFDGPINDDAFEEAITEALRGDDPLIDVDA